MPRLILCDLDGTLIRPGHPLSEECREAMKALVEQGDIVAIASGRSLYSGRHILLPGLPISYWLFSTGAGILDWTTQKVIYKNELSPEMVRQAAQVLIEGREDFMIQAPIPDNHKFVYCKFDRPENCGTDFFRRCEVYQDFCTPFEPDNYVYQSSSQLIAVLPPDDERINRIRARLPGYQVVRATSPLDNHSVWLEIFNRAAGKANAAIWLASQLKISPENTYAIGNDYNDCDMLDWAAHRFITPNSPQDMQKKYRVTTANTEGALPEALKAWNI